jgi:hypothetical protein
MALTSKHTSCEYIYIYIYIYIYCGVFTPCKNCNIETRSRDYATVEKAVFSPCRAELCCAVTSRASPRLVCCQPTAINTWMIHEWGGVTWPRRQLRHAFQRWCNNWSTVGRSVSRVSDQGFIGETETRLQEASVGDSRGKFVSCELWAVSLWRLKVWCEDFMCAIVQ